MVVAVVSAPVADTRWWKSWGPHVSVLLISAGMAIPTALIAALSGISAEVGEVLLVSWLMAVVGVVVEATRPK